MNYVKFIILGSPERYYALPYFVRHKSVVLVVKKECLSRRRAADRYQSELIS